MHFYFTNNINLNLYEGIQQNIADDHIIYINFQDYKYRAISNPDALYEYVESKINDTAKYYLFIDEIQNVLNFELVINSFRATHNISIFITGSNSKLLSGELATHLSGRTLSFRIMPLCFQEFGAYKPIEDNYPKYVISTDRIPMSRDGIIHMNLCDWLLSPEKEKTL